MGRRGGRQHIPRPPDARPGGPAPWRSLRPSARRLSLGEVRERCASLPPPERLSPGPGTTEAAVLVPLFEREGDGEVVVILIKRPETMPSHRGEIAFPGGRLQPSSDDSSLAAALREAEEEVGLRPEQVEVVAELDSVDTVVSGFVVSPFVGLLTAPPRLVPDPREVVDILQVPLSRLLEEGVYREEHWPGMRGVPDEDRGFGWRAIHFFELEDETVWGLTARILASFLTRLVAGR